MSLRVALDFSTLDGSGAQTGLFRYVVDLVRGFNRVAPTDARFLLLGSTPAPVPEVQAALSPAPERWSYERVPRGTHRGAYWMSHLAYWPILRRHRIQLFHSPHGFLPAACPCPAVCTIADLMLEIFPEYREAIATRPYRAQRWLARHRATRLIAISQTTARDIVERWQVPVDRVDVVQLGLSESFAFARGAAPPDETTVAVDSSAPAGPTILSPFNLEPRKNLRGLLEAVALVRRTLPVRLQLYGRAAWTLEREAVFRDDVRRLRLEGVVDLLGVVDDGVLAHHYQTCDLFVFPSLYEGFGYPVLEAMASGACVVARDGSAMAEVAGDAGILVDTADAGAMARAVESALADRQRRGARSTLARTRAAAFTTERMAHETLASYRAALARPR